MRLHKWEVAVLRARQATLGWKHSWLGQFQEGKHAGESVITAVVTDYVNFCEVTAEANICAPLPGSKKYNKHNNGFGFISLDAYTSHGWGISH